MADEQSVEEREQGSGGGEENGDDQSQEERAQEAAEKEQAAKEKVKELEDDPPDKLEDWPDDEAKYETFGGPEGEHSYDEGPEKNLGPASLRHHKGGGVSIAGEEVDDPEEFKSDPIPGGPTEPNAQPDS